MLDPNLRSWLDALYGAVRSTHVDCYEDTVTLLCLCVITGAM